MELTEGQVKDFEDFAQHPCWGLMCKWLDELIAAVRDKMETTPGQANLTDSQFRIAMAAYSARLKVYKAFKAKPLSIIRTYRELNEFAQEIPAETPLPGMVKRGSGNAKDSQ